MHCWGGGGDAMAAASDGETSMDGPSEGPASADEDEAEVLHPTASKGSVNTWLRLTRGGLHHDAWKAILDRIDMARCVLVPPAHTPTGFLRAALMHNEASLYAHVFVSMSGRQFCIPTASPQPVLLWSL